MFHFVWHKINFLIKKRSITSCCHVVSPLIIQNLGKFELNKIERKLGRSHHYNDIDFTPVCVHF